MDKWGSLDLTGGWDDRLFNSSDVTQYLAPTGISKK